MHRLSIPACLAGLIILVFPALPCRAQIAPLAAQDIFGGRIDSPCAANPRLPAQTSFTGGAGSGTTATIPMTNTSGWVAGEPVVITGTITQLDSNPTATYPHANLPTIARINPNVSLVLTLYTSILSVSGVNGTILPGFWYSGTVLAGPMAGNIEVCDPLDNYMRPLALSVFAPLTPAAPQISYSPFTPVPAAPVAGGSLPASQKATITLTYVTSLGETTPLNEANETTATDATCPTSGNCSIVINSPPASTSTLFTVSGYNVYATTCANPNVTVNGTCAAALSLKKQNASPIAIGTPFTWASSVAGATPPANNNAIIEAKYGVSSLCGVMTNLFSEFRGWHFTMVGEDSEGEAIPTNTSCNTQTTGYFPYLGGTDNVSALALDNNGNKADQATFDICNAWSPQFKIIQSAAYCKVSGSLVDAYSPHYLSYALQQEKSNQITSPWQVTTIRDDTDAISCTAAGPDFNSIGVHPSCNTAYVVMVSAPVMTLSNSKVRDASTLWPQVFPDPKNYSKMSSSYNPAFQSGSTTSTPPSSCSFSGTRCSLQDYLCGNAASLYATVAALNTAWGLTTGYYDTCGTDATTVFGATVSPAADGTTTTFTAALHTNVDPFSVQIIEGITDVGGDCPQWAKNCSGASGTGLLMSAHGFTGTSALTAGTVTYNTGAVTMTFATAPAAGTPITINYQWGGWPRGGPGGGGHGLMDEDGTTTSALGSSAVCLVDSLIYPGTCAHGDSPAPTAVDHTNSNYTCTVGSGCGGTGPDLDSWVAQFAAEYACQIRSAVETDDGIGVSSWGLNTTGGWGSPAHRGWYEGESQCTTAIFSDGSTFNTLDFTDAAQRLNFFAQWAVTGIPAIPENFTASGAGVGGKANANGCQNVGPCSATEAIKGQRWFNLNQTALGTDSFDNKSRLGGFTWWAPWRCLSGCGGDFSDYGVKTNMDNAYDGHEDVLTPVSCSTPLGAFPCGNDNGLPPAFTPADDAIGTATNGEILNANILWLLTQSTRPAPATNMIGAARLNPNITAAPRRK